MCAHVRVCMCVCVWGGVFVGVFVCGCGCQCSISVVNLSSMAAILKALGLVVSVGKRRWDNTNFSMDVHKKAGT